MHTVLCAKCRNAPGNAPRCHIFFFFFFFSNRSFSFSVFDLSICRVCSDAVHFVASAGGGVYIVSQDRLIRAPARYAVARTPVGTELVSGGVKREPVLPFYDYTMTRSVISKIYHTFEKLVNHDPPITAGRFHTPRGCSRRY